MRVSRRRFVASAVASLALPTLVRAQQPAPARRIGWLSSAPPVMPPATSTVLDAFVGRLRELGYDDGRRVIVEQRYADGDQRKLAQLARELAALPVDLIVATSTSAASEAMNATRSIPIVVGSSANPVAAGLVKSLARPGGNVTGLTLDTADLSAKRLQLLQEALPTVRRVAAIYPDELRTFPVVVQWLRDGEAAARALGIALTPIELGYEPSRWSEIFRQAAAGGIGAATVLETPPYIAHRVEFAQAAIGSRVATMFGVREHVEAGGLLAYGADLADLYRRAADYVDRILRGARPGDLPIEQPTKFTLAVNVGTARRLGVQLPNALLLRADVVLE